MKTMKYFTLCAVLGLGLLVLTAKGQSYLVNVDGNNYNVSLVTGTFNDLQIELEGTPWWGNEILAWDMSVTLQNEFLLSLFESNCAWGVNGGTVYVGDGSGPTDAINGFVVGEVVPVPEPSTLALAGLGGLSLLFLRRRK